MSLSADYPALEDCGSLRRWIIHEVLDCLPRTKHARSGGGLADENNKVSWISYIDINRAGNREINAHSQLRPIGYTLLIR